MRLWYNDAGKRTRDLPDPQEGSGSLISLLYNDDTRCGERLQGVNV